MSGDRTDPADWAGSYDKGAGSGPAPVEPVEAAGGPAIGPASGREAEALAFPERATWVMTRRALAHVADGLVYGLLYLVVLVPALLVSDALALVLIGLFIVPGPLVYYVLTQRSSGRSPGKRLAGIRVVDAEGRVPSTGALVRRTIPLLVEYFFFVAFLAMLFSPTRQRLGDRWAHTYVIGDREAQIEARGAEYSFSCARCGETFSTEKRALTHVESFHKDLFPDPRDGVVGA